MPGECRHASGHPRHVRIAVSPQKVVLICRDHVDTAVNSDGGERFRMIPAMSDVLLPLDVMSGDVPVQLLAPRLWDPLEHSLRHARDRRVFCMLHVLLPIVDPVGVRRPDDARVLVERTLTDQVRHASRWRRRLQAPVGSWHLDGLYW